MQPASRFACERRQRGQLLAGPRQTNSERRRNFLPREAERSKSYGDTLRARHPFMWRAGNPARSLGRGSAHGRRFPPSHAGLIMDPPQPLPGGSDPSDISSALLRLRLQRVRGIPSFTDLNSAATDGTDFPITFDACAVKSGSRAVRDPEPCACPKPAILVCMDARGRACTAPPQHCLDEVSTVLHAGLRYYRCKPLPLPFIKQKRRTIAPHAIQVMQASASTYPLPLRRTRSRPPAPAPSLRTERRKEELVLQQT